MRSLNDTHTLSGLDTVDRSSPTHAYDPPGTPGRLHASSTGRRQRPVRVLAGPEPGDPAAGGGQRRPSERWFTGP
ncbi:hypothetical protein AB0C13_15645 [Streptomyces sp. NPDC049099]|uniref:hypothetical protein n=1 Tax=Streptomyces sp. NPDC049099 TaxID=3155768 RepID=UPI00343AB968